MISKPSKKVSGKKTRPVKRLSPHSQWEFKPKLENEAIVLHSILDIYDIDYYNQIVNDIRELITRLVQNHNFTDGSKRYKIIKDYTLQLIEGRNPENPGWLATSEVHRVPSQLGENFCELLADCMRNTEVALQPKYYQVINTILNIVRMVDGLVEPELSSIIDKAKPIDQDLLDDFETYVSKSLVNIKKVEDIPNLFNIRFHVNKNGPNGIPKIESSIQEAVALLNSTLARPFRIVCQELNCEYLYKYLEILTESVTTSSEPVDFLDPKGGKAQATRLRVLARIPDSGFKTRVVAIVDFWSQLILEPFRSHVQAVIEKKFSKTDFRKDQDLGVAKMKEFVQRCLDSEIIERNGKTITLDAKHLYSYDISSWTDRLHRDLQKVVVKSLYTPRFAEAWAQLIVHCDWYYPSQDLTIRYGQGQGMGTNGSFDIATLTNHFFINYIIDNDPVIGRMFPYNQCYGEVGDDLWIYDPNGNIPKFFEKINLPINLSKSKGFSNGNSYMEFCSRTFLDVEDVSRVSPKIISKSKDFRYIPTLLGLCSSRGINLDASSFRTLNNNVKGTNETYLDKLQVWLATYLMIRETEQGSAFQSLDYSYLESGNWLKGELIPNLFNEPTLMIRLLICYSIVTLIENYESVEDKLFDLTFAMDDLGDEIIHLSEDDTNLFDIDNPKVAIALEGFKVNVLTPKQIIVLGRYVDQRKLLQVDFIEANDEVAFAEVPEDLLKYSRQLAKIANRSCYDDGNINYDAKRVYTRQYKMVKVLSMMDDSYTTITQLEAQQVRKIWQNLPYDELASKWEGYLPNFG